MNKLFNQHLFKQVIIGTKSQSRRALFRSLNLKFRYRAANIDEKKVKKLQNNKYDAIKIATEKARHLSKINKDKTLQIAHGGVIYPSVQTFRKLPKKKDIPPWYILKK